MNTFKEKKMYPTNNDHQSTLHFQSGNPMKESQIFYSLTKKINAYL